MDSADLAALDALEQEVRDVERALSRLDDGTYGTCDVCGDELPAELLAAAPGAQRCPSHAEVDGGAAGL